MAWVEPLLQITAMAEAQVFSYGDEKYGKLVKGICFIDISLIYYTELANEDQDHPPIGNVQIRSPRAL